MLPVKLFTGDLFGWREAHRVKAVFDEKQETVGRNCSNVVWHKTWDGAQTVAPVIVWNNANGCVVQAVVLLRVVDAKNRAQFWKRDADASEIWLETAEV